MKTQHKGAVRKIGTIGEVQRAPKGGAEPSSFGSKREETGSAEGGPETWGGGLHIL